MHLSRATTFVIILALISLTGCGSAGRSGPTGTIDGKLTLNGQPPPAGTQVQFVQEAGDAAGAEVSPDGSFTLMGVPVGSYRVMVTGAQGSAASGEMDPEAAMRLAAGEDQSGKGMKDDAFGSGASIPEKYTDFSTSGVQFEVKEGVNSFALDMKSG